MKADEGLDPSSGSLETWCKGSYGERREWLKAALRHQLADCGCVVSVEIEAGPVGREYDLTATVVTDAGRLRTPLWSHARASIFCDSSIHPANRQQVGPTEAVAAAADRLRRRLEVPYRLESRGLTITVTPENGVERTWTAEHSRFRNRTAVTREDRVERAADVDVRDLFAHFYTGPSLRLVGDGGAFLLPAASEVEGPMVTLCAACGRWAEGSHQRCPSCESDRVDQVIAARPPHR